MRRFVSLWLPSWPTDRWRRHSSSSAGRAAGTRSHGTAAAAPLALAAPGPGGVRLTAVDAAAAAEGLAPGLPLAEARALVPELVVAAADPAAEAAALDRLAGWGTRYTPWAAVDGADGLMLDITGCAHLFGGEAGLVADAAARLARAGVAVRTAAADTPAAAWAWARFRPPLASSPVLPAGAAAHPRLVRLPVVALRLPAALAADLARVGLRRIEDLARLPRAPLAARYGEAVLRRLDQLFGAAPEPIAPRPPPASWVSRVAFAEPIGRREDLEAATARLLGELCAKLRGAGRGARRLELALFGVDATVQRLAIGTSRPSHDPTHLHRLFQDRFEAADPGFGIEAMVLEAVAADPLEPAQTGFEDPADGTDLAPLIDRLRARAGEGQVARIVPRDTHLPERASPLRPFDPAARPAAAAAERPAAWGAGPPRPVMLLDRPEPIGVETAVPDGPPALFRWRGQGYHVGRLDGPERLTPEWWRDPEGRPRDYYRVEAIEGRRFWIFRLVDAGEGPPRWYLHGLFA